MRELHLHLDGSVRPETAFEISKKKGFGYTSVEEVRDNMVVPEDNKDLNEYLARFDLPVSIMQDEESLERIAYELGEDLAKLGLDYSEIRFAPQRHTAEGLSQLQVVEAVEEGILRAMKDYPSIKLTLTLSAMRGEGNEDQNFETLEVLEKTLSDTVSSFDLAGAEALYPTEKYEDLFKAAREKNLPFTIHAGEAAGPESVRKALEFGATRLGHGVRSIEDEELVQYLIDNKITLEVSVTSNINTNLVEKFEDHPIKKLYDKGVRVTVNSDNMTMSNTDLLQEIEVVKEHLGFTDEDIKIMDEWAKEVSFVK